MALSPVAIKDTGTALDIILKALGLPAYFKNIFLGIALIKEALEKDTSPEGQLKNLAVEIFDSIKKFTEKEANSDDAEAVIIAVKESLEQFKENAENNNENINNIFTASINNPNDLVDEICKEHSSLGGNAEDCYKRIIQMIVTTLCDEKSVELFLNQNYALVQLLKNNDNLSKELDKADCKIDELLKRNYLVESQLPPVSTQNPFYFSHEGIRFHGRKDELKQIEDFMLSEKPFTFWSITGKGGTGKSKLALHIAQEYIKRGWVVIWCKSSTDYNDIFRKEFIHPTLFIFDYADSLKEKICTVITKAKDKTQNIRLLFVERDKYTATSGMGVETWYSQLFNDKDLTTYKEDEYSSASLNLGALDNEAIKSMLDDFAKARTNGDRVFSPEEKENIIRYVEKKLRNKGVNADFSERCLFILFTADACLQEKSYLDWGAKELLDNYINQYADKLPSANNLKSHLNLLAIATATGGIDIEDEENNSIESLSSCIEKLKNDFSYDDDMTEGQAFIKSLCEKDEVDNIITPMYPDLVGEYFFISRISKQSSTTVKKWIKHIFLNEKYKDYFATFIVRGLMDWDTQKEWKDFVDLVLDELRDLIKLKAKNKLEKSDNYGNKIYLSYLYSKLASAYETKGNYNKQFEYFDKAREILQGVFPPNHMVLAELYNNLGKAYNNIGEYDKAIEYNEKALKIKEEVLPSNHLELAILYNDLGVAYGYKGNYDKSIEYYEKALEIKQKALPSDYLFLSGIYNNLGVTYRYIGEYDKAIGYFEKALVIRQDILPSNHQDLADLYNNLGNAYSNKSKYDKSIDYYKKALKIREEVLSSNHPDLAMSYNNLGATYRYIGEYDKAIELCKKALKVREDVLSSNHPDLAMSYNNLGTVYDVKGEYDKAIEYYEKALKIYQAVLPSNHLYLAGSYNNLGTVYDVKGEYDKAIEYLENALAIYKTALPNHPNIIGMYINIIMLYKKLNDTENAQKYIDELESLQKNDI